MKLSRKKEKKQLKFHLWQGDVHDFWWYNIRSLWVTIMVTGCHKYCYSGWEGGTCLAPTLSVIGKFRFFWRSYGRFYFSISTILATIVKGDFRKYQVSSSNGYGCLHFIVFNDKLFFFQMQQPMLIMFSKLLMWHLVAPSVLRFVKVWNSHYKKNCFMTSFI